MSFYDTIKKNSYAMTNAEYLVAIGNAQAERRGQLLKMQIIILVWILICIICLATMVIVVKITLAANTYSPSVFPSGAAVVLIFSAVFMCKNFLRLGKVEREFDSHIEEINRMRDQGLDLENINTSKMAIGVRNVTEIFGEIFFRPNPHKKA